MAQTAYQNRIKTGASPCVFPTATATTTPWEGATNDNSKIKHKERERSQHRRCLNKAKKKQRLGGKMYGETEGTPG